MQIHELNNFTGTLGSGAYLAVDDGNDTGKLSTQQLLAATEARIDNIIAGPAPSAEEIVDARRGDDGVIYPSLGDAIRDQVGDLKSDLNTLYATELTSVNVLNPDGLNVGAIQSDGTVATNGAWANYHTSDFIELKENTDYTFTVYNSAAHVISYTRKLVLLFDGSKSPIAETYQNVSSSTSVTFNSSTNAKYARVSAEADYYSLYEGDTAIEYQPYGEVKSLLIRLGDDSKNQVINEMILNAIGKNLVDSNVLVLGGIQSNGSIATNGAWENYRTSDYIELEQNTNYVLSTFNATYYTPTSTRKLLLLFDEDKLPIADSYQNVDGSSYLSLASADAKYIRVSFDSTELCQLEKGDAPTDYQAYSKTFNYRLGDIPLSQIPSKNILNGKKWVVCGDSFTDGATNNVITDGRYIGQKIVYPYLIGNRNDMDIIKFFASGRTLAYPSDGSFTNSLTAPSQTFYYQNIPVDADYITIYLGINDSHHETGQGGDGEDPTGIIPLGTINDNTTATYYGAWNIVLTWLITNRPFAHIGIIVSNGCDREAYRTAQLEIARKYGIPFIDLNGDDRTPVMIRSLNPNIADAVKSAVTQKQAVSYPSNTHPNDDAHLYESYFIEDFLRSI